MQGTPPQPAPARVTIPASPGGPAQTIAIPRTAAELDALSARRSELSTQLNSAQGRRRDIVRELEKASPSTKAGLEARLNVLDGRLLQIESDIAENGRAMASADASLLRAAQAEGPRPPGKFSSNQSFALSLFAIIFVMAPISIAAATRWLRRPSSPPLRADPIERERMDRLEQGIEAIAIEIERISEGQRFVTQLMSRNGTAASLGAGERAAEPLPVRAKETA
jgi:hypothetical protein